MVDCARRESGPHPMDEEDWWLHMYVMLSRATSLDDLVLLRAPDADFLLRGPPADLRDSLELFARRVRSTRVRAEQLARSLGWAIPLRDRFTKPCISTLLWRRPGGAHTRQGPCNPRGNEAVRGKTL